MQQGVLTQKLCLIAVRQLSALLQYLGGLTHTLPCALAAASSQGRQPIWKLHDKVCHLRYSRVFVVSSLCAVSQHSCVVAAHVKPC